MKNSSGSPLLAAVVLLFCFQTFHAFAQPTNIGCTNAAELLLDTNYTFNTASAGSPDDPTNICSSPFGKGVWFSFRAPRDGVLTLNTCGSDFDTVIGIYTGTCGALTDYSCADDNGPGCPGAQASVSFPVTENTTFYILVGGYNGASGNLQFTASISPPANAQCTNAIPLTNDTPYLMSTVGASSTNNPPNSPCNYGGYGVWFTYSASNTDLISISTAGSHVLTDIGVFTGDCDNFNSLACGAGPKLQFQATNGVTYRLFLTGYTQIYYGTYPAYGPIQIEVKEGGLPNDSCAGAIPMTDGVPCFTNTFRATSTGDPTPTCVSQYSFGNGIWYTFTPASNGVVTISTCGSDFQTDIQVYTGSCGALTPLPQACNYADGPACPGSASLSFEATGGVTYTILAGGFASATGNLEIQATLSPSLNDHCQNAIPMQEGMIYTQNTIGSTTDGDGGPPYNFANGVWYTFMPASNGVVTINTCGSDFPTALQVYTGNCGSFSLVQDGSSFGPGPGCTNRASVSFEAVGGVNYHILVGSDGSLAGNLQIQATLSPSLNDHCTNAIAMQDGVIYRRSTVASTSNGDPTPSCSYFYPIKGVWYTYNPSANGVVAINTCGSDFPTVLQVYTGTCNSLKPVTDGCNSGYGPLCPEAPQASTVFQSTAGVTYYILAGGASTGNLQIQATLFAAYTNDHCDGAIAVDNGVAYTQNTALATSSNDPPEYIGKGVWYSFTPSTNGVVTINTCGSDFTTALQVFTGNCDALTPVSEGENTGYGPLCQSNCASVVFLGTAGTKYLIFVGGFFGASGNLSFEASVVPPLPNDQCSGAIPIVADVTYSANISLATSAMDPTNQCSYYNGAYYYIITKGIWYQLTTPTSDMVTLSLGGSDINGGLQVYDGDCGQLNPLYCGSTSVNFYGQSNKTYLILAGSYGSQSGNLELTAFVRHPPNDECSRATPMIPGWEYTVNTSFASSTDDPVPLCDSTADHSVWYSYTPTINAPVTVETCDSDFETVVQVYSGDCSSLTPVACNDGFGSVCATNRASVSFLGKAGTNYLILAAGKNGASGNLSIIANGPPPTNDSCDTTVDMAEGVVYSTNTTYASSAGDAFPVAKGVWYRFTPTRAGLLLLTTCGSDFQTAFNVYTGACNSLTYYNSSATDVSGFCPTNHRASAEFLVSPGVTYYIDAGGEFGASGNLNISATMPPPSNDTCGNAMPLAFGYVSRMNTANATETGDPTPLCQTNFGKGVWFTITPPMSGTISISTCAGDLDTVMQVYTGGCGALTPVANSCNDDNGPDCNGFTASVHFAGQSGVTYWILVGGYGGAGGNLGIEACILPMLAMQRTATNSILSWPSNMNGFWPEFTTNLTPPVFWNSITGAATFKDGNYFLTNSIPGNAIFYRLKK
jgi:hypothetical protein